MSTWMWVGVVVASLVVLVWVGLWNRRRYARRAARERARRDARNNSAWDAGSDGLLVVDDLLSVPRSARSGVPRGTVDDVAPAPNAPSGFQTGGGFGGRAMEAKVASAEVAAVPMVVPMEVSSTVGDDGFATGGGFGGAEVDADSWSDLAGDAADSLGDLAEGAVEVAGAVVGGVIEVVTNAG